MYFLKFCLQEAFHFAEAVEWMDIYEEILACKYSTAEKLTGFLISPLTFECNCHINTWH